MPRWRERYGSTYTIRAMNGDVVLFCDPEAVREIFRAPPDAFRPFAVETVAPILGPTSLILTEGERHRRDRKLLMPPFHGERMRTYAAIMRDTAVRVFAEAEGSETTTRELAQAISLEVIIRAVFGVEKPERVALFATQIASFTREFAPALGFFRFLQKDWFPPWRRFSRNYASFDAMLQTQIDAAREREGGEDILSLLLGARYEDGESMSDEEVKDQLRTLLMAGHETTATHLCWTLDLLLREPEALRIAGEEASTAWSESLDEEDPARLGKVPYLEACWKEAARIRPQITEVLRTLTRDMTFGGTRVPAGAAVSPSVLMVHHDPTVYPEPERYRPERFLERRYAPHEFFPFGGGNRRCIGAAFSAFEMQIVLAVLLANYDVSLLAAPAQPVRTNIVMGPKGGVPLRLTGLT
jgi:cytochrome P450